MQRLLERDRELDAVDALLERGGTLVIEGRAGIGKTALLDAASERAPGSGREVMRARGSELEAGFAFGVVRQLFERRVARADENERGRLLAGPAGAVRSLLLDEVAEASVFDRSFAVLHGLYWLTVNLSDVRPLLIAVDDAHWADEPSLRCLRYLAPRLEGAAVALLVALRAPPTGVTAGSDRALLDEAQTVLRPEALSAEAVRAIVRGVLGSEASAQFCEAIWVASGGNPMFLGELLRTARAQDRLLGALDPQELLAGGAEAVTRRVLAGVQSVHPRAWAFAQALAVLGDDCELRHAASLVGVEASEAIRIGAELVRLEVLATDDPPRFIHPVVRAAVEASLASDERDGLHRSAARQLDADGAPPGQVAAHLAGLRAVGDEWVVDRLREAGHAAMRGGAPAAAADLLGRALSEPPLRTRRVLILRELAQAEVSAGRETACAHLEEARALLVDPRERAVIALEAGEAYAALFRWTDAVDLIERALGELGEGDAALTARMQSQLLVCGAHDARCASRVASVEPPLPQLLSGSAAEAVAVARGMGMLRAGRPAREAAAPLEKALVRAQARAQGWEANGLRPAPGDRLRAALLWSLIIAERFDLVEAALGPMLSEVQRSGSARGLVAVYGSLGLLRLRCGALSEADAAARVALRVLQEGDFAPGLALAATVLCDVAVEAGVLNEAEALISLLPQDGWAADVATILIPAARGRLRLAQGRPARAVTDFRTSLAMLNEWGSATRDVGYLHARAGAAQALLQLGEREAAIQMVRAELTDVRVFGAPRALGISTRVAGLAEGGERGLELLHESVASLRRSPARLELAHSLTDLGAALRRAGARSAASGPLAEGLELAVRCGAGRLAARAREELRATGARPRREWRTGVEALTPSELRVVRLAGAGATNREIAHQLYVTLKTVEGHLSRAYQKLGVKGREELARVLAPEKSRVTTL